MSSYCWLTTEKLAEIVGGPSTVQNDQWRWAALELDRRRMAKEPFISIDPIWVIGPPISEAR